jgi:uncharacterized protein YdhG (YjbR/CyaY superfamily)
VPATALTIEDYIAGLPPERQEVVAKLCAVLRDNLPAGFAETISYGLPGWVVPKSVYPAGYHCDPKLPLPFVSVGSQSAHVALYHMGLYADPALMAWFTGEWPKHTDTPLDIGKSCLRFKKLDRIPYGLVGALAARMTPADWIALYERALRPAEK